MELIKPTLVNRDAKQYRALVETNILADGWCCITCNENF